MIDMYAHTKTTKGTTVIMSHDPLETMIDHTVVMHWSKAMGLGPHMVFNHPNVDNVYQYAKATDQWFEAPRVNNVTYDFNHPNMEYFRLAMVHEALAGLRDISIHLDDDPTPLIEALTRLGANDPDEHGNQAWFTTPQPYSIVWRTWAEDAGKMPVDY